MAVRKIVRIDEELCNGCGECMPACAEGAIRIIDGKARLVGDARCDGLGNCLGECPQGAISIEEREADDYDERLVHEHLAVPAAGPASALRQWPVQLHLVPPAAPYYQGADVVLAADCTAFAMGDFHARLLAGKAVAVACPKLDQGQEIYLRKLVAMIDQARINTLTVAIMEVPCCGGLIRLAAEAVRQAGRKVPLKQVTVGIRGDILAEEWL